MLENKSIELYFLRETLDETSGFFGQFHFSCSTSVASARKIQLFKPLTSYPKTYSDPYSIYICFRNGLGIGRGRSFPLLGVNYPRSFFANQPIFLHPLFRRKVMAYWLIPERYVPDILNGTSLLRCMKTT